MKTLNNIHPDDLQTFEQARELAYKLAAYIKEELRAFEHKRRPLFGGAVGLCYCAERRISVVIRHKHRASEGGGWFKKPLPKQFIFDTVAHEVAHLVYPKHSKEFYALEEELIERIPIELG
jgi:predicted metal-dependent hydrolase